MKKISKKIQFKLFSYLKKNDFESCKSEWFSMTVIYKKHDFFNGNLYSWLYTKHKHKFK